MKKEDVVTIEITDLTAEGEGIGRIDTFTLFVKDAVVGDTVECRIMKLKKTYGYAKLIRIVRPSLERVAPRCPKARPCGGCQIQEMSYDAALRFKTGKVRESLRRIGGLLKQEEFPVYNCIGMEEPWRYRNKALVPFGKDKSGRIVAGFYAGRTHSIIEAEDCFLTPPEFAGIIETVKAHLNTYKIPVYCEETHQGLMRHLLIRKGFSTGEISVCAIINGKAFPKAEQLKETLDSFCRRRGLLFRSFSININQKPGNTILSPETVVLYGDSYIEDKIGDLRFRISPNSFFQINPVMTKVLYEKALAFAGLTGRETVWDLYSGIGTISLFLARQAKKVYGVEVVQQAISDARENARLNGIENAEFFVGRAEQVLPAWRSAHPGERIDVIVTDPPREGCDPDCIATMLDLSPARIVYVSCNPATLARDLKILSEGGYRIKEVQPVDMFPWTGHVETVCCLYHQKNDFISVPYEPKDAECLKK